MKNLFNETAEDRKRLRSVWHAFGRGLAPAAAFAMVWICLGCCLVSLAIGLPAQAAEEQKTNSSQQIAPQLSTGQLTPTAEMWFYQENLRQYQDPKTAVRQKAEYRLAQRQRRMAALKWYGFSNQRPVACSDPLNSDYSPKWTGSAVNYPNRWIQTARPWVVVRSGSVGTY